MIYWILSTLFLVGIIGWQYTEIQILRQKLDESEDFCAELDPVELYAEGQKYE